MKTIRMLALASIMILVALVNIGCTIPLENDSKVVTDVYKINTLDEFEKPDRKFPHESIFMETDIFVPLEDRNQAKTAVVGPDDSLSNDIWTPSHFNGSGELLHVSSRNFAEDDFIMEQSPTGYITYRRKNELSLNLSKKTRAYGWGLYSKDRNYCIGYRTPKGFCITKYSVNDGKIQWSIDDLRPKCIKWVGNRLCVIGSPFTTFNKNRIYVIDIATGLTRHGIKYNRDIGVRAHYIQHSIVSDNYVWFLGSYTIGMKNQKEYYNIFRYNPVNNDVVMLDYFKDTGRVPYSDLEYNDVVLYGERLFLISERNKIISEIDQDTGVVIENYDINEIDPNIDITHIKNQPISLVINNDRYIWHPDIQDFKMKVTELYVFARHEPYYRSKYFYAQINNRLCGFNKETGEVGWWIDIDANNLGEKPSIILDNEHGVLVRHGSKISLFGVEN